MAFFPQFAQPALAPGFEGKNEVSFLFPLYVFMKDILDETFEHRQFTYSFGNTFHDFTSLH